MQIEPGNQRPIGTKRVDRMLMPRAMIVVAMLAGSSALAQQGHAPADVRACVPCHRIDGIAPDEEVPHLAGQHEVYLYNQLQAFRAGRRKQTDMHHMTKDMTDEDMLSLARYFANLPRS